MTTAPPPPHDLPRPDDPVLRAQEHLLARLNVTPQPVSDGQYVRVATRALGSVSVFGQRHADPSPAFTGWQITSLDDLGEDQPFGQHRVDELAAQHPAWRVALCLPTGWSFRCTGHTLIDGVAPDGHTHPLMLSIDA